MRAISTEELNAFPLSFILTLRMFAFGVDEGIGGPVFKHPLEKHSPEQQLLLLEAGRELQLLELHFIQRLHGHQEHTATVTFIVGVLRANALEQFHQDLWSIRADLSVSRSDRGQQTEPNT